MKMYEFLFIYTEMVQIKNIPDNGLQLGRQQAIIWTNVA